MNNENESRGAGKLANGMGPAHRSVLTIAGSDSSGGAGIQADIKTIAAHGLFAQSVITALTAQNTTGVYGVVEVSPEFVEQQIDAVFSDIRPDAVKIGMVSSPEIIRAIARALVRHKARNIVVDPVMVATSGSALIHDEAVATLVEELFPLATIVTPNLPETEVLCGFEVKSKADAEAAADAIEKRCEANESLAVLVKGGHGLEDEAEGRTSDLLSLPQGLYIWLEGKHIETNNTHGTGCTLSSAIACGLASGLPLDEAVSFAKDYIVGALEAGLDLGRGNGPLDHMWCHR